MTQHDQEFPECPCVTGECVWDNIGGKRVQWCNECVELMQTGMQTRMHDILEAAEFRCCYDLDEGHAPSPGGRHTRSRKVGSNG